MKPLDWKKVDNLLMAGCHGTEIAANFDMHPDTFYNKVKDEKKMGFTEYSTLKKQHGDSLLRAKQFEKAIEKDNTMMIWLGKQRLGQKEHIENNAPPNDSALTNHLEHQKLIYENKLLKDELNEIKSKTKPSSE